MTACEWSLSESHGSSDCPSRLCILAEYDVKLDDELRIVRSSSEYVPSTPFRVALMTIHSSPSPVANMN